MNKTLIILATAFNPSQLHHTAFGEIRIMQYCLGLARVAELLRRNENYDALIVDNTITPDWKMPARLDEAIAAMPRTRKVFFLDNTLGSQNKGCGVVVDWRHAAKETNNFTGYEYVIHFEPRLILLDFSFFDRFEAVPANYILIENIRHHSTNKLKNAVLAIIRLTTKQCWTGLFSADRETFLKISSDISIEKMAQEKSSLEQVFYNQAGDWFKGVDRLGVLWHDGFTNKFIVY